MSEPAAGYVLAAGANVGPLGAARLGTGRALAVICLFEFSSVLGHCLVILNLELWGKQYTEHERL